MGLECLAKAAESISYSDIIYKKIRQKNEWSLMPSFGFHSSIYPTQLVHSHTPFPKFPEYFLIKKSLLFRWLGKNSSMTKINRESKELKAQMAK